LELQPLRKSSFEQYLDVCKDRVGDHIEQGAFYEQELARRELRNQSREIANKLESVGIRAYENDTDITLVGLATGEAIQLDSFRQINFIPSVAKKKRSPRLKVLEYYLDLADDQDHLPNSHKSRMWVFNMGWRVGLGGIRERSRQLHRKISKLAFEAKAKYGIEFLFRSTELGSLNRSTEQDATFHVHAHVLVKCPKIADWSGCLRWVNSRWRKMCHMSPNQKWKPFNDAGKIRNARELCKYIVKPSDVLQLTPTELKELYEQTFGLHTVEFSGSLQALKNRLDRGHVKPVRRNKGESWKWELMPSVNRKADTYGTTLDLTEDVNQPESLEVNKWNQVYALLHPSFYFTTHAEPAVLVSKYTGSLDDLLDESLQCADVRNALLEVDGKTCGVPQDAVTYSRQLYNVHNRSKTVQPVKMDDKQLTYATHDPPIPEPF
jgi:hypothetical protein